MLGMAVGQGASFVVCMSPFWLKTVLHRDRSCSPPLVHGVPKTDAHLVHVSEFRMYCL